MSVLLRFTSGARYGAGQERLLAMSACDRLLSRRHHLMKKVDGQTVTVTVHKNRAEDALEHPGFTCTGDTH